MTHTEKILTAALYRCAHALACAIESRPDEVKAAAIAAMNVSLAAGRNETDHWLRLMEEGARTYQSRGGKTLFELGRKRP